MKHLLFIVITSTFFFVAKGQKENEEYESTKGKWDFPINNIQSIDTSAWGCGIFSSPHFNLTLKTNCYQQVRANQPGIVQAVINVEDNCHMVLIKSGDYFLAYIGLRKPQIKKGKKLNQGEPIGNLERGDDGETYDLTLMLVKGIKKLNSNSW